MHLEWNGQRFDPITPEAWQVAFPAEPPTGDWIVALFKRHRSVLEGYRRSDGVFVVNFRQGAGSRSAPETFNWDDVRKLFEQFRDDPDDLRHAMSWPPASEWQRDTKYIYKSFGLSTTDYLSREILWQFTAAYTIFLASSVLSFINFGEYIHSDIWNNVILLLGGGAPLIALFVLFSAFWFLWCIITTVSLSRRIAAVSRWEISVATKTDGKLCRGELNHNKQRNNLNATILDPRSVSNSQEKIEYGFTKVVRQHVIDDVGLVQDGSLISVRVDPNDPRRAVVDHDATLYDISARTCSIAAFAIIAMIYILFYVKIPGVDVKAPRWFLVFLYLNFLPFLSIYLISMIGIIRSMFIKRHIESWPFVECLLLSSFIVFEFRSRVYCYRVLVRHAKGDRVVELPWLSESRSSRNPIISKERSGIIGSTLFLREVPHADIGGRYVFDDKVLLSNLVRGALFSGVAALLLYLFLGTPELHKRSDLPPSHPPYIERTVAAHGKPPEIALQADVRL